MKVDCYVSHKFRVCSYKIHSCLIDTADEWDGFYRTDIVLLTHAHFDHIEGLNRLFELNPNVRVFTNAHGIKMLQDAKKNLSKFNESPFVFNHVDNVHLVNDGDEVVLSDGFVARAVFTPGHNPSCISWLIGDCLFTGDSYIPGIKTVTNLPGGNKYKAEKSEKMILNLAQDLTIYPGHRS